MPWCPKCKSEYRDGFTVCADCGCKLVDSLEDKDYALLCQFIDKELADKFISYLSYSKLDSKLEEGESNDSEPIPYFEVFVESKKFKEGRNAINAFVQVEEDLFAKQNIDSSFFIGSKSALLEEIEEAETEEDSASLDNEDIDVELESESHDSGKGASDIIVPESSVIYESKSFKAEESYNTGIMLICFGVIGLAYDVYNYLKIAKEFNLSVIVLFVFFVAMVTYGVYSVIASKKLRIEAKEENDFVESVQIWLNDNISKADLISQDNPGDSAELNYFSRTSYIKKRINDEFPDLEDNFTDELTEDFYESIFGTK